MRGGSVWTIFSLRLGPSTLFQLKGKIPSVLLFFCTIRLAQQASPKVSRRRTITWCPRSRCQLQTGKLFRQHSASQPLKLRSPLTFICRDRMLAVIPWYHITGGCVTMMYPIHMCKRPKCIRTRQCLVLTADTSSRANCRTSSLRAQDIFRCY